MKKPCEICGKEADEIHHLIYPELSEFDHPLDVVQDVLSTLSPEDLYPEEQDNPENREQLVVCHPCHCKIHAKPLGTSVELLELEGWRDNLSREYSLANRDYPLKEEDFQPAPIIWSELEIIRGELIRRGQTG